MAAEALNQLPNGSGAEAQIAGDDRRSLAAIGPPQDELAKGEREWCRHGNPRK
jgi:hypothetical protein